MKTLAFNKKYFSEVETNKTHTRASITKFRCKRAALLNFMFPLGEGHGEKTWKILREEEEGEKAQ